MSLVVEPGMSPVENIIFSTRVEQAKNNLVQRLCWERCIDTISDVGLKEEDSLPLPSRQCVDACTSKFSDTAVLVQYHTQVWQAEAIRQHQIQTLVTRAAIGAGALAAVAGVGCYLFHGDHDD
eukprot:gnl/TRDRNA2_/TRDRNA2_190563_c0_seq1.p2 gnl/TRDRNA2_/TRDRNA2_190563_c0~~gnl/TRDRNA2_/TRDRNA2_190563_c0_seq1.p2  ORF type:complete len:123 (+),score=24.18 gnl/TRDRNA2_/TRDRNA2_190563_c0_seq1:96-464(+)